jgi:hypothetical protein
MHAAPNLEVHEVTEKWGRAGGAFSPPAPDLLKISIQGPGWR